MNKIAWIVLTTAALTLQACAALAAPPDLPLAHSIVVNVGSRGVDSKDATGDSNDMAAVVGLEYSQHVDGGLGWEAGYSYSEQEEFMSLFLIANADRMEVWEVFAGVRGAYLGFSDQGAGFQPYASAGLAGFTMDGREDDATAIGIYASGGLRYVFGFGLTAGVETKWLASSSDYIENYGQLTFQFGWTF